MFLQKKPHLSEASYCFVTSHSSSVQFQCSCMLVIGCYQMTMGNQTAPTRQQVKESKEQPFPVCAWLFSFNNQASGYCGVTESTVRGCIALKRQGKCQETCSLPVWNIKLCVKTFFYVEVNMMIKMVGTMMLPNSAIEVFTFPSSELTVTSTGHMNTPHERPKSAHFTTAIPF